MRDKRKWIDNLTEEAQTAAKNNNSRVLYKITKMLLSNPISVNRPVKMEME